MNIKQYRYISDNNSDNINIKTKDEIGYNSNDAFTNKQIKQLGIQAPFGTKFKINDSNELIVGITEIFELDLNDNVIINNLQFNNDSLVNIENTEGASLLIDILYDEGDD